MDTITAAFLLIDRVLTLGTFASGIKESATAASEKLKAKHAAGETVSDEEIQAELAAIDANLDMAERNLHPESAGAAGGPTEEPPPAD